MKPNRVPENLIQAGSDAIRAWYTANPDKYLDDRTQMRIVVAAALTLYNEQVEQPLRERAEAAEAQFKALMQYTHEIGEAQAGLPTLEAAMARVSYWQALQRATAEGAKRWQARADAAEGAWSAQQDIIEAERRRAETAERELAALRDLIGDAKTEWASDAPGFFFTMPFTTKDGMRRHVAEVREKGVGAVLKQRLVGEWRTAEQETEEPA